MSKDYHYEKAPLIEVIAEIHWALKQLQIAPFVKIDPDYEKFESEILNYLSKIDISLRMPTEVFKISLK